MGDREDAVAWADPAREGAPSGELLVGEDAELLAVGQESRPGDERFGGAEEIRATDVRQERRLGAIEPAADEAGGLLRAGQWTRDHERVLRATQGTGHRAAARAFL